MALARQLISMMLLPGMLAIMIATAPVNAQESSSYTPFSKAQIMERNQYFLKDAGEDIKKYGTWDGPDATGWLGQASDDLDEVNLAVDPVTQIQMRNNKLLALLQILAIIDHDTDPHFDLAHPPSIGIWGGDMIWDSDVFNKEILKERQEHNAKAAYASKQLDLHAIDDAVSKQTKDFILMAYTSSREDRRTLKDAIEKTITNPKRKAELLKLLPALPGARPG